MQVRRYKLDKVLLKGTVERIIPVTGDTKGTEEQESPSVAEKETEIVEDEAKKKVKYFLVELQDGSVLKARQVVLATGPTRAQMSNIPEWVNSIGESYPEERLQHTVHVMHKLPNFKQRLQETPTQGKEHFSFSLHKL